MEGGYWSTACAGCDVAVVGPHVCLCLHPLDGLATAAPLALHPVSHMGYCSAAKQNRQVMSVMLALLQGLVTEMLVLQATWTHLPTMILLSGQSINSEQTNVHTTSHWGATICWTPSPHPSCFPAPGQLARASPSPTCRLE